MIRHPNVRRNLIYCADILRLKENPSDKDDFEVLGQVNCTNVYDMGEREKEQHGMTSVARAGWCQCSVISDKDVRERDVLAVEGARFRIVQSQPIPRLNPHLLILRVEIR